MPGPRKTLALVLFGCLLLAAGCSGAPNVGVTTPIPDLPTSLPPAPTTAGGDAATPAQVLTNTDSGKTVNLKVGQVLSVQLRDRRWSPPSVNADVLQPQVLNVTVPEGVTRWDYKAVAAGTSTFTTEGSCLSNPGGPNCLSIIVYKLTITVTP
jgi:hypothetical protein